jgi:hypothetical protein
MPSYRNVTHEMLVSPDARRVYIHCTEWPCVNPGVDQEVKVPLVMICHINDDTLIELVDIYWKTPEITVEWTKAQGVIAG